MWPQPQSLLSRLHPLSQDVQRLLASLGCCLFCYPVFMYQKFGEWGHWKGVVAWNCLKLTFKFAANLRQICAPFLMYETKYQQFCAIFLARYLRQIFATPPSQTPPSRDFWMYGSMMQLTRKVGYIGHGSNVLQPTRRATTRGFR